MTFYSLEKKNFAYAACDFNYQCIDDKCNLGGFCEPPTIPNTCNYNSDCGEVLTNLGYVCMNNGSCVCDLNSTLNSTGVNITGVFYAPLCGIFL